VSQEKVSERTSLQTEICFTLDKEVCPNLVCKTSKERELQALFVVVKQVGTTFFSLNSSFWNLCPEILLFVKLPLQEGFKVYRPLFSCATATTLSVVRS